jgi:putative transposase
VVLEKYHRQSTRLKNFDYASNGAYHVTICAWKRERWFGEIQNDKMILNEVGKIILEEWNQTRELRPNVVLDAFVIMPNHIHAIIVLVNPDESTNVGVRRVSPLQHNDFDDNQTIQKSKSALPNGATKGSLGAIVGSIKAAVSKRVNQARGVSGLTIWQRGFHDRIIRNEAELERTRTYIEHNPANWVTDEENR